MFIIFFDSKNSSWQAKQLIPHTTVMFYVECLKMCKGFSPDFGDKRTGCYITTMHRLTLPFLPANFSQKQHDTTHSIILCLPN
jgi:hypothetical protein